MWELLGRIVCVLLGLATLVTCATELGAASRARTRDERRVEAALWVGGTLALAAAGAFFVVALHPSSDAVFVLPAAYLARTANKRLCQRSLRASRSQTAG